MLCLMPAFVFAQQAPSWGKNSYYNLSKTPKPADWPQDIPYITPEIIQSGDMRELAGADFLVFF